MSETKGIMEIMLIGLTSSSSWKPSYQHDDEYQNDNEQQHYATHSRANDDRSCPCRRVGGY